MNAGRTIFSQLMEFLPIHEFQQCYIKIAPVICVRRQADVSIKQKNGKCETQGPEGPESVWRNRGVQSRDCPVTMFVVELSPTRFTFPRS